MVMQNSWIIYGKNRSHVEPKLDLLAFGRQIVDIYMQKYSTRRSETGRPSGRILPAKRKVCNEVKLDRMEHYQSALEKQKSCGHCGKNTRRVVQRVALVFTIIVSKSGTSINRSKYIFEDKQQFYQFSVVLFNFLAL